MNKLLEAGFVGVVAITLTATATASGPKWDEMGDAGSLPAGAQITMGNGQMVGINGGLGMMLLSGEIDFEDMFLINIVDPENFRVTTDPADPELRDLAPFANFNSQLWLFKPSPANPLHALGFLGNDDHPDTGNFQSLLIPVPTDGSPPLVEPGLYLIAITRFNIKEGVPNRNDPVSNGGEIFFQEEPQEISGPDGPGGKMKIIGWTSDQGEFDGEYRVGLRGVEFAQSPPPPCGPGNGDCCEANGTPGCDDPDCCEIVCAIDPFCCDETWDGICAGAAEDLCGDLCFVPPPENDNCEDATPLVVPAFVTGTTDRATPDEPPAFFCGTSISAPGVWYSVIGTGTTMTATTCTDFFGYDTKISVFCGDCFSDLLCVGGNDDDCADGASGLLSTVSWCSQVGAEYLILVHGFAGQTGDFELEVFDDGVNCDAVVLCLPTGACCFSDGGCLVTTQDDCLAQGGEYQGDDTQCFNPAGNPQVTVSNPNLPIPDNDPMGVSDTIVIPDADGVTIGDVDVDVVIDHTWIGDLVITLEHNDNVVTLWDRACSSENDMDVIFDDEGNPLVCAEPTTGNITPLSADGTALSLFDGQNSAGGWTITVTDNAGADLGTLLQWSLHIDEGVPKCEGPCPWDLDGNGSVGVGDLLILLGAWGPNPGHPADFDGSGDVGVTDLLKLLANWGPCP